MQYISGPYTQGQLLKDINEIETSLTNRFLINGVITDAAEQRSWRERVEDASFGRNTVMYDDQNNPSVMVAFPLQTRVDLGVGTLIQPHEAFIVNGATKSVFYNSKYLNITRGSGATLRALSLKGMDPGNIINFDNAALACKQKGAGWHLMTNAEWTAVALSTKKQGFMPRGNNLYGVDNGVTSKKGIASYFESSKIARTLTGSGPLAWAHDGTPFGIYDLNGNVWEWVGGMRLSNGEIQILANNNAADNTKDQSAVSTEWKAILTDGSLVAPGTADTLKYDYTAPPTASSGSIELATTIVNPQPDDVASGSKSFETLPAHAGITVPDIAKSLGLFPVDAAHGGDYFYFRNNGERLPFRGGHWGNGASAGVFFLNLNSPRSSVHTYFGFRSAFVL